MTAYIKTWEVEQHAPVRADAESMFVSRDHLPHASIGDHIVITSDDDEQRRTGVVVDVDDDSEVPSFRVDLDPVR